MEETNDNTSTKRKIRPTQRLYVPPAQRNKQPPANIKCENIPKEPIKSSENDREIMNKEENEKGEKKIDVASNELIKESLDKIVESVNIMDLKESKESTKEDERLVINVKNNRTGPDKNESEVDKEKEEMQRAIVNINRKTRPLIKHVNVKDDVLQIDVKKTSNKSNKKSPVKLVQVANWEDLYLEDDQEDNYDDQLVYVNEDEPEPEEIDIVNPQMQELDHVIELYDFPSSLKTQDIMQIYSEINKESMYVKWCDETHALLILGSSMQARRALDLQHDMIKSRPMTIASPKATEIATKSDLRPAMKRPQTSMHAARRMITTALGAKNIISREEQQKEREALRIAKELKRTRRQNERDAWEGNPRPSTA